MKPRKEKIYEYTILLTPDEESGGFAVEVPALPGCFTQGKTVLEAKKYAKEAIELYLETLAERGFSFPEDVEPNFFKSKVEVKHRKPPHHGENWHTAPNGHSIAHERYSQRHAPEYHSPFGANSGRIFETHVNLCNLRAFARKF
jgi:predicted RNase H-like HicB family nuclease